MTWLTKKLGEKLFYSVATIIIIIPFIYIYSIKPDKTFWDNSMGNMFATVLALIAGIPVALWIDRHAKSREEHQKYLNYKKREKEILELIKEELSFSYSSLFLKGKKGNTTTMSIQPLKSDLWDSLISSEDIKYIDSPSLLNRISSAYYVLKIIKNIEWQAFIALRTSAIQFTLPDGTKKNAAQTLLVDARGFDKLFEDSIKEAIRMIDERLIMLTKYEN